MERIIPTKFYGKDRRNRSLCVLAEGYLTGQKGVGIGACQEVSAEVRFRCAFRR
jgi:hypothetical protein